MVSTVYIGVLWLLSFSLIVCIFCGGFREQNEADKIAEKYEGLWS